MRISIVMTCGEMSNSLTHRQIILALYIYIDLSKQTPDPAWPDFSGEKPSLFYFSNSIGQGL